MSSEMCVIISLHVSKLQIPSYMCIVLAFSLYAKTSLTTNCTVFLSPRFSDALSYLLSCKVTQKNRNFSYYHGVSVTATDQRLTNMSQYRRKCVLLLAKTGKINQALNVLTLPISTDITRDVMTRTVLKGQLHNSYFHLELAGCKKIILGLALQAALL